MNDSPSPGLALLLDPPGRPSVRLHLGLANVELNVPIDDTTAFNVGSVAKQITAHLVLLSARRGLLSLSRPVSDFLPRFRIPDVTVADLLTHHGGVRDAESLLSLAGFRELDHYIAEDLLELAYRQTRRAIPPGQFLYSNTGYLLLVQILHIVHGVSLEELGKRELFFSLGMTSARFKSDPSQVIPGAASAYRLSPAGWCHCARPVSLPGPGSFWCTMADLDRWLDYLHQEWVETGLELPFENDLTYRPSDHSPYVYGAGLYARQQQQEAPEPSAVFHYGHEQGFSAAAYLDRQGLRIVCLSNNAAISADHVATAVCKAFRRDPDEDLDHILSQTVATYLQRTSAQVPTHTTGDQEEESHVMLGAYMCDDVPGILRLSQSNGALFLWRRGTRDRLIPNGPNTYSGTGYTITVPETSREAYRIECFTLNLTRAPDLLYQASDHQ